MRRQGPVEHRALLFSGDREIRPGRPRPTSRESQPQEPVSLPVSETVSCPAC